MKKNVLVFGSISGLIITLTMVISTLLMYKDPDFTGSMIVGFAAQFVAFIFIFVGIRNFREKYNNGYITYGKALVVGLLIALISSTFYVLTWAIEYNYIMPDFMEKYSEHMLNQAKSAGAGAAELAATTAQMEGYKEAYKNPVMFTLLTYVEVLPQGILMALIAAAVFRKKEKAGMVA